MELTVRIERAFNENCLPHTMGLAGRFRASVIQRLPSGYREWPYEDQVLVWLAPFLAKDASAFHITGGPGMTTIFNSHFLEHLDEVMSDELRSRLDENLSPKPEQTIR
jgi:hypothetical protein